MEQIKACKYSILPSTSRHLLTRVTPDNPFSKRESHTSRSLLAYKVLTVASWFLVHVVDIHFGFNAPAGDHTNPSIWGQNHAHPTPFSLNPYIVDIYWYASALFLQPIPSF